MYKISEVAEIIGIEKTEVFEKMITHRNLLDPNIQKQDGVTYFNERGLEILKTLMGRETKEPSSNGIQGVEIKDQTKRSRSHGKYDREKKILLDKVDILINEIKSLDQELALKDEMILKYQDKLDEELEMMGKIQGVLIKNIENIME